VIKVKNVTKYYGSVKAVENVTFDIDKGEIAGFLGPNGAGKSTVLKIITAILTPTSGSVEVSGLDVTKYPVEVKRKIGYLSENNPLYPDYSPKEYLTFIAKSRGLDKVKQRVDEAMERVFITDVADRRISKLSRGYRQRVGIAASLIGEPDVLLLDEPTVGLDPAQIVEIRELIREIGKTNTIFLSTHILQEVTQLCKKIVIINEGHIVAVDTPEGLSQKLSEKNQFFMLVRKDSPENLTDKLLDIKGVLTVSVEPEKEDIYKCYITSAPDMEIRPNLVKTIISSGGDLLELRPLMSNLEEVFVRLTREGESLK